MTTNYFIVCHACKIPFDKSKISDYTNKNLKLHHDVKLDEISCDYKLDVEFDIDNFNEEPMTYENMEYDYILSFKDPHYGSSDFDLFGIFNLQSKNEKIQILNVTNGERRDILLSELLRFLVNKRNRTNVYCSFCRQDCNSNDEIPTLTANELVYGIPEQDGLSALDDFELDDEWMDMDEFSFTNGGRKRRNTKSKTTKRLKTKKLKRKRKWSRRKKQKKQKN